MKKTDFYPPGHLLDRTVSCKKINFEGLSVEVIYKLIKNVYIKILPPHGDVRISVPVGMHIYDVKSILASKFDQIRKTRQKIQQASLKKSQQFEEGKTHHLWGQEYILSIEEKKAAPSVRLDEKKIILTVPPETEAHKKKNIMETWYRNQIREKALPLIDKWEETIKVRVEKLFIRRMKTRWGTCNVTRQTIRLNTLLALRPVQCLEYIIVHEMTHILEPSHNKRFKMLMNEFLPGWKHSHKFLS